ncbi:MULTISPECIES: N-acetylmuramoyl-L-alanine amidase [Bacillus]|uniref:N-acetylmuramoyl-L-alanine amidase n=1 Tax=Bacillus TaxID=1386 RepID=UPI002282FFA2|nr:MULTISPECIES: N-acetylmuramoyl-L-alanine amidase [Bacillus]MCY8180907.1 N-acetylmuramoyl-L-alanine amidase [Bacillus paralicheniformis]MCY8664894.1 N-acetylmuramoyl-L-alanine amidase [Bacillus haynesii]MCY8712482.1 N-acetylmuramoyl-L-alanine amidase [Bacillus haynesii]
MKKVWLDAGHGGADPGASGYGLQEKDLVLKIVKYAKSYLEANYKNVQVKLTRSTDVFYRLSKRASMANQWGADLFVSVHANAGNGKGTGFETFRYNGTGGNTLKFQECLHKEILSTMKAFGQISDRGLKQANYAVLRETRMPAVLTENLFIDRKEDADKLKDSGFLKAVGEAHARGIAKYLGLSGGTSKQPAASKPKKEAPKKKSSTSGGRAIVKTIQSTLNKRYGLKIKVDGYPGPETRKALLKGFQTELNKQFNAGLVVDGLWGPKTRAAAINVRKGARGNLTWILQALLICKGYEVNGLDSIFGSGLQKAVRAFQKASGLSADSIAGKATWAKLFN